MRKEWEFYYFNVLILESKESNNPTQKLSFMILFKNYKGLEKTKILITNFSIGDGDGGNGRYYLNFLNRKSMDVVY